MRTATKRKTARRKPGARNVAPPPQHEAHVRAWRFYSRFGDGYVERLEGGCGVLARFAAEGIMIEDLVLLDAKHRDEGLEEQFRRVRPGAAKRLRATAADLRPFPARMALGVRRLAAQITVGEALKELADGHNGAEVAVWLEDAARELDESGTRGGRPPEVRKAGYRAGWKALALARSGRPLHGLGAIAFNAAFGANETADTFRSHLR